MRSRYQISCVQRSDRLNHDRRIRGIGGVNPDGTRWTISSEAAIAAIEEGRWRFFVSHGGRQADVVVAVSRYGTRYLKSADDKLQPDDLLALPECR